MGLEKPLSEPEAILLFLGLLKKEIELIREALYQFV